MVYDHIIIGAGSAGCVLASRLSADPTRRVLLVEAGPRDWHPFIHMPAGLARLVTRTDLNWNYLTEPQAHLDGRRLWWPRGKVLGGSSSINAMCYVRGVPADYDGWARLAGDERWAWRNVLPYFLRAECNSRGASALHGGDGPLAVSDLRDHSELSDALVDAAAAAGHPRNDDFNGASQAGFGLYQVTQRNGARCSAATAYLAPARGRGSLDIVTHARCERVLLERGRAVGVQVRRRRGEAERIEAGEVILAGGSINSPQLLMLSGIGPADHLRAHGITVARDLPGVGANLSDHLDICTLVHCTRPVTYDRLHDSLVALQFVVCRRGAGTSNLAEAGGFVRTRFAGDARCDMQFHFLPALLDDHGRHRLEGAGYTLHACGLKPRSRGTIRLRSADPGVDAAIDPGYLSDPDGYDLRMLIEGVRLSREIFAQPPFDKYRGEEIFPGADVRDDAAVEAFIRRKAETIYHPIGTCRMGHADHAVVDPELRVHGVEGLRVVDASVIPELPSGNTNAPTIMLAELASDLMRGRAA
jgi:choline dehydrogenase-like flavoprotein